MRASVVFAGGTIVGVLVATAALLLLHFLPTGYRPFRDAVSAYGVGRFRRLYQLQVVASGLGALALAAGLVAEAVRFGLGIDLLAVYGAARVAIARFPTDLEPPLTPTGRRHALLAALAFISIGLAAPLVARDLGDRWQTVPAWLPILSAIVPAGALATFATSSAPALRGAFGAVERVFYVSAFGWLLAVAAIALSR
jgi:hypothetical protein